MIYTFKNALWSKALSVSLAVTMFAIPIVTTLQICNTPKTTDFVVEFVQGKTIHSEQPCFIEPTSIFDERIATIQTNPFQKLGLAPQAKVKTPEISEIADKNIQNVITEEPEAGLTKEVEIIEEVTEISSIETEIQVETPISEPLFILTDEEMDYFAKCVYAEAGNQGDIGIRLVIDVILNRCVRFNCRPIDVINAPNQFAVVDDGALNRAPALDSIKQLISEELVTEYNTEVLYFRTEHFHDFGTPLFQHGAHYFSTR